MTEPTDPEQVAAEAFAAAGLTPTEQIDQAPTWVLLYPAARRLPEGWLLGCTVESDGVTALVLSTANDLGAIATETTFTTDPLGVAMLVAAAGVALADVSPAPVAPTYGERVHAVLRDAIEERKANCPEGADPVAGLVGFEGRLEGLLWEVQTIAHEEGDKLRIVLRCREDLVLTFADPSPEHVRRSRHFGGKIG